MDTVKGCELGIKNNPNGCWGLCYAKKIADRYGLDFSKSVTRYITNPLHFKRVENEIKKKEVLFVRIGTMGDPCHNWKFTVNRCQVVSKYKKPIVIITKHWIPLTDEEMKHLGEYKVIINTSISPLDTAEQVKYRLEQYNRYKKFGKSILRIVSCEFNLTNPIGKDLNKLQQSLFKNENIIDNPLRCPSSYTMVKSGIIKVKKVKDINSEVYMSKFNPNTYVGICKDCPELCGIKL